MAAQNIEALKAMRIGCDMAHYALLTKDNGTDDPTWGTPVPLPGVMTMNVNPNSSIETAFYDDGPGEVATTLGNIEVSFNKSALSTFEKANLLGITIDDAGVLWSASDDIPPWIALGFRTLRSDGKYRYVWLYKGKFTEPADNNETKGESINFQSDEITGRFVKLNKEFTVQDNSSGADVSKKVVPWKIEFEDDDTKTIDPANWFDAVKKPSDNITT